MQRPIHHDDRGDDIILLVAAGFAKSWESADIDPGNMLYLNRRAVRLRQDNFLNVVKPIALRQIAFAAAVEKAYATNIHRLLADVDGPSPDVDVGVADGADQLRQCNVIRIEFIEIGLDFKFFGHAAPGVDLDDTGDAQQPALQHPILNCAKIGQSKVGGADELIAKDLANQAAALNGRLYVVREGYALLKIERRLREREVIVDPIVEHDANERQAIK
jgi:hypothetical protein